MIPRANITAWRAQALEELMATKLRALYQRRKGRDVYEKALILPAGI